MSAKRRDSETTARGASSSSPTFSSSPAAACASQDESARRKLSNGLHTHPELRELLGLCAESNDWTLEDATRRPDSITFMELFLLQVPHVPLVQYFPNLVAVKFMNIGLQSMADFASLAHIEELWLSDNNLRTIEGLENATTLRRLFLQGNQISSLEGLPPLRHLRELWVSRNKLRHLSHLKPLRKLRALYVGDNPIETLDDAFSKEMTHLHDVNLSGCRICDVGQLCYLQQLPCLRNVWFADPLFGDNPICRFSHYGTLTLSMLDTLDSLDGAYVTADQRSLAESVLRKKQAYYEMRAQMLDIRIVRLARQAEQCVSRDTDGAGGAALRELKYLLQLVEVELQERAARGPISSKGPAVPSNGEVLGPLASHFRSEDAGEAAPPSTAQLESLRAQLHRAVDTCEVLHLTTHIRLADATRAATREAALLKERFAVELHTAGNVRLEAVLPTHDDFVAVNDLLQDRFDPQLYAPRFGIDGVTVTEVRRIVNGGLRLRFDDRVKELQVDLANPQQRCRFVGLFGVVPVTVDGQRVCLQRALVRGVGVVAAAADTRERKDSDGSSTPPYAATSLAEGIPLTNALFHADEARLLACTSGAAQSGGDSPTATLCHGQVILYRTYLGKTVHAMGSGGGGGGGGSATPRSYLERSGRVLAKDYGSGITAAYRALPDADKTHPSSKATATRTPPVSFNTSYVWYCFDRALIVPDCVVTYTYTLADTSRTLPAHAVSMSGASIRLDRAAVAAMVRATCFDSSDGTLKGTPERNQKKEDGPARTNGGGRSAAASVLLEDVVDCADPLVRFVQWCGSPSASTVAVPGECATPLASTLRQVVTKQTAEAREGATKVLGHAVVTRLLLDVQLHETHRGIEKESQILSSPLQCQHIEAYAARLHLSGNDLKVCALRSMNLTALSKDFACPPLATVTTLDLSCNRLVELSWFALAKEAPQLQRLLLCGNQLSRLHLDGSKILSLRILDMSYNRLERVTDFAAIRVCAPALEELELRGNPFLSHQTNQEAAALLWSYVLPPSAMEPPSSDSSRSSALDPAAVKVNAESLRSYPGTLAAQRYRRACLLSGSPHPTPRRSTRVLAHYTRRLKAAASRTAGEASSNTSSGNGSLHNGSWGDEGDSAAVSALTRLFSIDGVSVPERCSEALVCQMERWTSAEELDNALAEAIRAQQVQQQSGTPPVGGEADVACCFRECQDLQWCHALLTDTRGLVALLPNLCHVTLRGHCLTSMEPLLYLSRLESLDVSENHLTQLPCLAELKHLRELRLDFNDLSSLTKEVGPLPLLRVLSASGNRLMHVEAGVFLSPCVSSAESPASSTGGKISPAPSPPSSPLSSSTRLEALYLMYNGIDDMNVIYGLRELYSLLVLSVTGNPCTSGFPSEPLQQQQQLQSPSPEAEQKMAGGDVRQYLIHVFPQLKVLDGESVSVAEVAKARELYAGKINQDLLIDKAQGPPDTWRTVRTLNLSHCCLTEVKLLDPFVSLEVLQLQHNLLSTMSGVSSFAHLKALDLSHNRLGTAAWRGGAHANTNTNTNTINNSGGGPYASGGAYIALGDALAALTLLESLSLESNQLTDLSTLRLRLPGLKFLNLRGNDLQHLLRGLEQLPELRELLLDQNKLRSFAVDCFVGSRKLTILSAENNSLKALDGLRSCGRLEQLRLGANRLLDMRGTLSDMQSCPLKALVLIGNPVARKSNYRTTMISHFSLLTELDRRPIAAEEREKAAAARMTEFVAPPNVVIDLDFLAANSPLPGIMLSGSNVIVSAPGASSAGGVPGNLPSRSRIAAPASVVTGGVRRAGGGGSGPAAVDRFNVNARSRPYRR